MILEALLEFRDRIEGDVLPAYHKNQSVRWFLDVDENGRFLGFVETGGTRNELAEVPAPYVRRAGTRPPPYLLVDKAEYVLGVHPDEGLTERASQRHEDYVELVRSCGEAADDGHLLAFIKFLKNDLESARSDPATSDMKPGDLIAPRVEETLLTEIRPVREFWQDHQDARASEKSDLEAECLGCGDKKAVARTHPVELKMGPNRPGLITGNEDAFLSYGLEKSEVAPLCHACARRYGESLRHLLERDRHHVYLSDVTWLYWTQEPTDWSLHELIVEPDLESVERLLRSAELGRTTELDTNRFYALVVSSNKSRLVVRSWLELSLDEVRSNLGRYFQNQRVLGGRDERFHGLWSLGGSTVRELDDLPPRFYPLLLAHALTGEPLPMWILQQALARARVEPKGPGVHARASVINLVLLSRPRAEEKREMTPSELSSDHPNPAYHCGRLLAVLDDIQRNAVGAKATIIDRYYGAASTTPGAVFGVLLRGVQNHLGKLRKNSPGLYHHFNGLLGEVMGRLEPGSGFPKTLSMEEQGLFALGFYQQKYTRQSDESEEEERE